MLSATDADRLGLAAGDQVAVTHAGGVHTGPLRLSRRSRDGAVRINWRGAPASGAATVEPA